MSHQTVSSVSSIYVRKDNSLITLIPMQKSYSGNAQITFDFYQLLLYYSINKDVSRNQ